MLVLLKFENKVERGINHFNLNLNYNGKCKFAWRLICLLKRSCGKVMFSHLCVCLSTGLCPCDHYPWCIGSHCTGNLHPSLFKLWTSWDWPHLPPSGTPMLVTSGGYDWRPVQTCLNLRTSNLTSSGYLRSTYSWCKRTVRILLEFFYCYKSYFALLPLLSTTFYTEICSVALHKSI